MTDYNYSNVQIDTDILPSIQDIDFQALDKSYLKVEIIGITIIWLIIAGGVNTGFFLSDVKPTWIPYLILGIFTILITFSYVVTIKGFYRKGYALRQLDIIYKEGLLWKKQSLVPFNRIQHAEVNQGPIERMFDLGELNIYTAGGSSSDLSIKGISKEKAMSIKHFLLSKTAMDEEE